MLVIIGSIALLIALLVAVVGVLSNAGPDHPLSPFSVLGYHVTGSTGAWRFTASGEMTRE